VGRRLARRKNGTLRTCCLIWRQTPKRADQTIEAYTPFVHPDDIAGFNAALREHLKGGAATFECSYRTLDVPP
jgi:hypothetical protein